MAAVALRMPSHYVPVEAEEMEYVGGGYTSTYIGNQAWMQISMYCGNTLSWGQLAAYFGTLLVGGAITFETGVGAIVGCLAALGLLASASFCALGLTNVIGAIYFTLNQGGFVEHGIGLFGLGIYIVEGLE